MKKKAKKLIAIFLLASFLVSTNGNINAKQLKTDRSETQVSQQQDSTKVITSDEKPEVEVKDVKTEEIKDKIPPYSSILSLNFIFYLIYKYTFREF